VAARNRCGPPTKTQRPGGATEMLRGGFSSCRTIDKADQNTVSTWQGGGLKSEEKSVTAANVP
jgi:hypothetical protein